MSQESKRKTAEARKMETLKKMKKTATMEKKTKTTKADTKPKRRCCKILSPQIGSIYDILHDHASVALYVHPLAWTDLHTQVLGCRFVRNPPPKITPASSYSRLENSVNILLRALTHPSTSARSRTDTLKILLETLFPHRLSGTFSSLYMRCGNSKLTPTIECAAMWKVNQELHSFSSATTWESDHPEDSKSELFVTSESFVTAPCDTPILAFLDRRRLNFERMFGRRPLQARPFDLIIQGLIKIRGAMLLPKIPDEDQYILATMLAMAQQHVYGNPMTGGGFQPKDVRVSVLTIADDDESFIVYNSIIPKGFLQMFDDLSKAPQGNSQVIIEYQQVPMAPTHDLHTRLGSALGEEIIGKPETGEMMMFSADSFSDAIGDNHEANSIPVREQVASMFQNYGRGQQSITNMSVATSPKRKREILSEVFNTSFSEDREPPPFSNDLTKRRCTKEGRIGIAR
ncbi:hypothetical protein F5Y04DRAFT_245862 [Hypomontagnella monticulosa]|nr:hypothetical protein F5Y04DRAFT_245862 [Hypomontagnella monticulosa]